VVAGRARALLRQETATPPILSDQPLNDINKNTFVTLHYKSTSTRAYGNSRDFTLAYGLSL
jgi:hypothetical protein